MEGLAPRIAKFAEEPPYKSVIVFNYLARLLRWSAFALRVFLRFFISWRVSETPAPTFLVFFLPVVSLTFESECSLFTLEALV